jgi:hypothetical protein
VVRKVGGILRAVAKGEESYDAVDRLADEMAQTMALADLIGRRRLLLEADAADAEPEARDMAAFATDAVRGFPEVPFLEAIRDLVTREPRLADSAEEVARLYREQHAFAIATKVEQRVVERLQGILAQAARGGIDRVGAQRLIEEAGPFARGYAETVYRTNMATAYNAGRFQQARLPGVAKVIAAFERWEVMDSDVRRGRPEDHGENHAAVHGLVAAVNDPIWETHSAPGGYNCRGGQRFLSRKDVERLGLLRADGTVERRLPAGIGSYRPHPRFAVSPVARFYRGEGEIL